MNDRKRKTLRIVLKCAVILLTVIVLLAIAAAGVCYHKYRSVEAQNVPVEIVEAVHYNVSDGKVTLGEGFWAEMVLNLPWNKSIGAIDVSVKDGVQKTAEPSFFRVRTGFGYCLWKVYVPLQTYHLFESLNEPVALTVQCKSKGGVETLSVTLPPLTSTYTQKLEDNMPVLASPLNPESGAGKWGVGKIIAYSIVCLFILALVVSLLYYLYRKNHGKKSCKTLLQITLEQLQELRNDVETYGLPAQSAMSQLTFILRGYFERRYHWPAERYTSAEFIEHLRRSKDSMELNQQSFVENFLRTTDKIKYANMPTDNQTVLSAIDDIEEMLRMNETMLQSRAMHSDTDA